MCDIVNQKNVSGLDENKTLQTFSTLLIRHLNLLNSFEFQKKKQVISFLLNINVNDVLYPI
jgi:hypothetical protein